MQEQIRNYFNFFESVRFLDNMHVWAHRAVAYIFSFHLETFNVCLGDDWGKFGRSEPKTIETAY